MGKFVDLSGQVFGRLTVIKRVEDRIQPNGHHKVQYLCECSCPKHTQIIVQQTHLKSGHTQSCGCLNAELASQRLAERDRARAKHRKYDTRLYKIYSGMVERCTMYRNDSQYTNYIEKGITICPEWHDPNSKDTIDVDRFREFYNWAMTNGYRDDLTLDRIDVNGNYEPSNCRWATPKEQMLNRSNNRLIEYNGELYPIGTVANILNVDYDWFHRRLYTNNYDINNIKQPVQTPYGEVYTICNYQAPVPTNAIYYVDQYGFPVTEADYVPPQPQPALWNCDDKGFITGPILNQ